MCSELIVPVVRRSCHCSFPPGSAFFHSRGGCRGRRKGGQLLLSRWHVAREPQMFTVSRQRRRPIGQKHLDQVRHGYVQLLCLTLQPLPGWRIESKAQRDVHVLLYITRHQMLSRRRRRWRARTAYPSAFASSGCCGTVTWGMILA